MQANYALHYVENSDTQVISTVRFFSSLENARKAMKTSFDNANTILHFPPSDPADPGYNEDADTYTSISEDAISVCDEMDSYDWEILRIVPEDAEDEKMLWST